LIEQARANACDRGVRLPLAWALASSAWLMVANCSGAKAAGRPLAGRRRRAFAGFVVAAWVLG
jgi:hypothetical protein